MHCFFCVLPVAGVLKPYQQFMVIAVISLVFLPGLLRGQTWVTACFHLAAQLVDDIHDGEALSRHELKHPFLGVPLRQIRLLLGEKAAFGALSEYTQQFAALH